MQFLSRNDFARRKDFFEEQAMDVKSLYTLLAIVDHRSFAAAGKAVGLSPSGVSLQMKGLEGELGQRLFDRSARPPQLTAEGRLFARRARGISGISHLPGIGRASQLIYRSLRRDSASADVLRHEETRRRFAPRNPADPAAGVRPASLSRP